MAIMLSLTTFLCIPCLPSIVSIITCTVTTHEEQVTSLIPLILSLSADQVESNSRGIIPKNYSSHPGSTGENDGFRHNFIRKVIYISTSS